MVCALRARPRAALCSPHAAGSPCRVLLQLDGLNPGGACFGGRAAWSELGELPSLEAKREYALMAARLLPEWDPGETSGASGPAGPVFSVLVHAAEDDSAGAGNEARPWSHNFCWLDSLARVSCCAPQQSLRRSVPPLLESKQWTLSSAGIAAQSIEQPESGSHSWRAPNCWTSAKFGPPTRLGKRGAGRLQRSRQHQQ